MASMPRAHRWLFTLLSGALFLILAAKLVYPIWVKAQAAPTTPSGAAAATGGSCDPRIGPELAFFDSGSQKDVYAKVVKAHGFGGPVQVINMVTEAPHNPAPDNPVVLRIADVTARTSDSTITKYANALKESKNLFPKGTVVFFGNEVSNLEIEWRDQSVSLSRAAQDYAAMYILFAQTLGHDHFRVAPSPPDLYNGVWNPETWVRAFAAAVARDCSSIDVLTANVYNVDPAVPGVTNLTTYQYWENQINARCPGKKVVHFSGWGENPNQGAGIQAQIDFFAKNPLPQGIESAATLIVDTCNGFDSNVVKKGWLYYICTGGQGKVYTAGGRRVKNDCSTDTNTYYEYTLNRPDAQNILNNFYDEYSVSCLPQNEYTLAIRNRNKCLQYGLCDDWNTTGTLTLSANGKLLGLYRDEAAANQRLSFREAMEERKESIETYFSSKKSMTLEDAKTIDQDDPAQIDSFTTTTGVIYKISDVIKQCDFAKEKLQAVEFLCRPENRVKISDDEMSDDPEIQAQCAVDEEIANSSYTHTSLLSAISSRSCNDLMQPTNDEETKRLQQAVLEVRQTMEGAYRPAFIVIATTPKDEGKNTELGHQYPDPKSTNGWTVVDFMEVKVPAFASDFINPATANPTSPTNTAERFYKDSLRLAADAIVSQTFQDNFFKQDAQERAAAKNANAGISGRNIGDFGTVKCRSEVDGQAPVDCNTIPLAQALTTFINAYPSAVGVKTAGDALVPLSPQERAEVGATMALKCEVPSARFFPNEDETKFETAQEIGSKLEAKDGYYIGSGDDEELVERKKEAKVDLSVSSKSIEDKEDMSINDTTRVFFVSPYGNNLRYARLAFDSLIDNSPKAQEALKTGEFNSLVLADLNRQLEGREATREFTTLEQEPIEPSDPGSDTTIRRIRDYIGYQLKIVAKTDDQINKQPLLWQVAGNVANYPTRLFTLVATAVDSTVHQFTRSCKGNYATEDWLRENCDISNADKDTTKPQPDQNVCSAKYNVQVKLPTADTEAKRMGEVATVVRNVAEKNGLSDQETYLLWGLLEIEGGNYLRAVRRGDASITCFDQTKPTSDMMNSCGAVGPFQVVDGICTTQECGAYESMSKLVKTQTGEQLCSLEGAATFAATKIKNDRSYVDGILQRRGFDVDKEHVYFLAARYAGLNLNVLGSHCTANACPAGSSCEGGAPVQGCDGVGENPGPNNYCQCAYSSTFAARFRQHLRAVGERVPQGGP